MNTKLIKCLVTSFVFSVIITACSPSNAVDTEVKKEMQKIENQVAADAVAQYEIAKKGGDKMQTYVQAGLVAAAYLQAKDQVNYDKWKAIEKQDAKAAGMEDVSE
jgi:hypothetical protein